MKNLKKILMTLVLVALVVSAAVTVAVAEGAYAGTVTDAKVLLNNAIAAKPGDGSTPEDAKVEPLKALYTYLLTVDPNEDGYNEIKDHYNQMTFKVAYSLYDAVADCTTLTAKSEALAAVYEYVASAPVICDSTDDVAYYHGFKCINDGCGKYRDFTEAEFLNGITDAHRCPGICSEQNQKLVYASDEEELYTYSDFELDINKESVDIASSLMAALYGMAESETAGTADYYDLLAAAKIFVDFIDGSVEEGTVVTPSEIYVGDVTVAAQLVKGLGTSSSFEGLKAALADTYEYLIENPVMPTSAAYLEFIKKYNDLGDVLVDKFVAELEECESISDKVEAFSSFYEYLADTQISEKVVNAYNELRAEFVGQIGEAATLIEEIEAIEAAIPEVEYRTDFAEFVAAIGAAEAAFAAEEDITAKIVEIYNFVSSFMRAGNFDPTTEGYDVAVSRYVLLCNAYAERTFVDVIDNAETMSEKFIALQSFYQFINACPLCESVTDMYDAARDELFEKAAALLDTLTSIEELPTYTAPEVTVPTSVAAVLNDMLAKVQSACDKYDAAEAGAKADILEEMKTELDKLYRYILGNGIDVEANSEFIQYYSIARSRVVDAILGVVDAAQTADAKLAALKSAKEYLETTPVAYSEIVKYNAVAEEVAGDEFELAYIVSVYEEIYMYTDLIADDADFESYFSYGLILAEYSKTLFDVTDPEYNVCMAEIQAAFTKIGDGIRANLPVILAGASAEEYAYIISFFIDYASYVNDEYVVNAVCESINALNTEVDEILNSAEDTKYQSLAEAFLELVAQFDAAETFEERLEINNIFFVYFNGAGYDTTELKLSASYELISAEAERIAAAVEAELLAMIEAEGSPDTKAINLGMVYIYLSACPFSETLIDKYNEAYEAIIETDFDAYAESVSKSVLAVEYVTPEGFSEYVARINLALDLYDETGEFEYFSVAYFILCAIQGVDGAEAMDFGVENFASVIGRFALAKDALVEANVELFESAETLAEKGAAVAAIKEMAETVPYLADIQQSYADICSRLNIEYKSLLDTTLANFITIADQIAAHLDGCPINTDLLAASDNVYYSRCNTIESFIDIIHFTVVEQMLTSYDSFSGETKLAYQKMLADKIEKYIASNGLEVFNESTLVSTTIKFAFEEFINKFDKQLESADLATKARDIKAIRDYLVLNNYPSELVDLYNAKFGLALSYNAAAAAEDSGSIAEFGALVDKVDFADDANAIFFAVENLVKYANEHKLDTTEKSAVLKNELAGILEQITADTKAQVEEFEANVSNVEYAYPVFAKFDHEDSALYKATMNTTKGTVSVIGEVDNKYAQMSVAANNECYLDINTVDGGIGVVADFDLMAPGSLDFVLYLVTSNGQINVVDFAGGVLQYGDVEYSRYQKGVSEQIAIAPEQWVHITVVANYKEATVELFVNYASLGIMNLDKLGAVSAVRMQPKLSSAATLTCYDNLNVYSGTMYRTLDKAESIGADELFKAYVESIYNEEFTVQARMNLYYTAATYKEAASAAVNEYKVLFDSFDTAPLVAELCDKYLTELETQAKSLVLDQITSKNIATHVKTVTTVETFINANRQYMVGERFKAVSELLIAVKAKQVWFTNLTAATTHLTRFQRATSIASLTRHLELFLQYYTLCALDIEENMIEAEKDPICQTFVTSMKAESDVVAYLSNVTFASYCQEYIPYRVQKQTYRENSTKIIDAIDFIKKLAGDEKNYENSDAFYAVLAEKAKANYDYTESYLGVVRGIVLVDAYDGNVDGVIDAITLANKLDVELAEIRKDKQLAVIKDKLDEYALTTSYIEKAGICTFLDNYIAEYNIDMSTQDAIQYYYALQIYKAELENYMVDYEEVLESNTQAFIGLVDKMQSYVTYTELKPLYEEAISKYYYSMNIDSEEATAAVEIFEKYKTMILDWESNSALFIAQVKELSASARQAQQFRALVKCANYIDKIDTGIAGVSEALTKYNSVLASYSEMINPALSDMAEIGGVVCSLRVNSMPAAVLAVLNRMMGN